MATIPYMQLYVADYLADTQHLDTEEHGAYILLLMNQWHTEKPIPANRLARIAKLSNERWTVVENTLSEFFDIDPETGLWSHPRVEKELERVYAQSKKNSKAGKKSAQVRRAKAIEKAKESNKRSTSVDTNVATEVQQKVNHKDKDKDKDNRYKRPPSSVDDDARFDAFWANYPKKVDKKKAKVAFNRLNRGDQWKAIKDPKGRYVDTPKQFIPNPTTYIHGEKWNDEVITREETQRSKSADIFEQGTRDAYDS